MFKPNKARKKLLESIDDHFIKIVAPKNGRKPLDIFILDLKNYDEFDATLRTAIMNKINAPDYPFKVLRDSEEHFKIIN